MKYETRLMNIRQPSIGENHAAGKDGFMEGHRDARHAAALIGCEADAEIERLRSLTTWQPIETAPKDGRVILGYFTAEYVETMAFCDGGWVWSHDGDTWTVTWPTHWLPLPTPPES